MGVWILLIILLLNFLCALGYLLWGLLKRRKEEQERGHRGKYILVFLFLLACPVVGLAFLGLSQVVYILLSQKEVDMTDVSFDKSRVKVYVEADVEREINYAPMQEVLMVSDVARRRRLLLDVLKRDVRKSLGSIAIALDNPDSETSHYAASVIVDVLSEFRANVQNMFVELKEDPENTQLALLLMEYIHDVLNQKILSEGETRSYVYLLDEVGTMVFEENKEDLSGREYRWLMEHLTSVSDFQTGEKWAVRSMKYRDYQLDSYIGCLKLYYTYGDRDAFFRCMERLKTSGTVVNQEIMELIRIFEG